MPRLIRLRPRSASYSALNAASTEVYRPDPALFRFTGPQVYLDSRYDRGGVALTWASDTTLTDTGDPATNATNLQTAINDASTRAGHTRIRLPEGFIANGNIKLRKHTMGAYWTYIESVAASSYASEGSRCDTALMGSAPQVRVEAGTVSAIRCEQGADYTRFVGVRFRKLTAVTDFVYAIVELNSTNGTNDDNQTLLAHAPQWIIIDRCWVDGDNSNGVQNGIKMNTREFCLVDSVVDGCFWTGTESHAVAGYNGVGPQKYVNNKLEGGAIGIIWGGAVPGISGAVYADVEFRRNWMTRRLTWLKYAGSWDGVTRGVKNQWEVKEGERFLVEGNVIEYASQDGQNGAIIVTKVSNPGDFSYTAALTRNITFRYNWVRETSRVWDFVDLDDPSGPVASSPTRIDVRHNLFTEISKLAYVEHVAGSPTNSPPMFQLTSGNDALVIDHNTFVQPASGTTCVAALSYNNGSVPTLTNHEVENNVIAAVSTYAIFGDGGYFGQGAVDQYALGAAISANVMIESTDPDVTEAMMPVGNEYPTTIAAIGFADYAGGNFRLGGSSPYLGLCADGSDPGADLDLVDLATSGVAG